MAKLQTTGRYEEIYRITRPDGMVRWIQDRAFPIVNERGEVYRVAGIAEDITAWKATEESLRTSEERFRSLFEAAPIGIALLGAEGHYLRINRVYCELLGYSEVELLRLGTKRVTHPEDVNRGQELHRELLSGARDHYAREKRLMTKDGRMIHALSATSAVRDAAGKLRYIVSMLLDVTDRKRLQNEVLAISSLERRRIGHDLHDGLGQFLSGIAFKAKCLEEVLQAEAPAAEPSANELVRLLNSAVSQARTLARGLDPVEAEVGGLVPAMHKLAAESAKLFSLGCTFESNVPELSLDNGVALHLFRIAQEAITNAARHGGARHISVRLSQGVDDLRLKIEDDGCGFVLDQRPPDVGLGLRTMQYRADTVGASLQIWSSPDEGTGIECVLPLEPGAPQPEQPPQSGTL
jgi:PAS domain S-box-containing protein